MESELENLPDELLFEICSGMSEEELKAMTRTSGRIRNICREVLLDTQINRLVDEALTEYVSDIFSLNQLWRKGKQKIELKVNPEYESITVFMKGVTVTHPLIDSLQGVIGMDINFQLPRTRENLYSIFSFFLQNNFTKKNLLDIESHT